jgi:ferredoxin
MSSLKILFSKSAREVEWNNKLKNLLELAEANNIYPEYSCRMGTCMTCQTPLLKGTITYDPEPFIEPESDQVLLCCSKPLSDLIIEL